MTQLGVRLRTWRGKAPEERPGSRDRLNETRREKGLDDGAAPPRETGLQIRESPQRLLVERNKRSRSGGHARVAAQLLVEILRLPFK